MLLILFVAQLAVTDSTYSSSALRGVVEAASRLNRRVPAALAGYRASAESEVSILARRTEGTEGAVSVEQVQNEVQWLRTGEFEQRVIGYRAQSAGLSLSTLSFFRQAWTVPMLYGNRLSLLVGRDTSRRRVGGLRQRNRVVAVHPLADDRDRVYRFSGGDTVITMRVDGRDIPIVRVVVEPKRDMPLRTVAFRGELHVDAARHQLIRMRGYFVSTRLPPSLVQRVVTLGGLATIAFVELENGEIEGQYWLPTYQRFEVQVGWSSATDSRSVFRVITRFRNHRVNDTLVVAADDSLSPHPFRLTYAPRDSIERFAQWRTELGTATGSVLADDFDDISPDVWRPTGRPRFGWRTQRLMDLAHVNRVEGLYTGFGAELKLRDAAPGVTLRANAGWAWSEARARGRVSGEWKRAPMVYTLRADHRLDITNDFRSVFDSGSTIAAVFGADNYDYVDRRVAALGVARHLGKERSAIVRWESGPARDAMVVRHLSRGVFRSDSGFRENRGVRSGDYWRTWGALEWHPHVNAEFMQTGMGALFTVENARGDLAYTRFDARLVARVNHGRFTIAGRLDGGTLAGNSPPPQQLYELGSNQNLPGYEYKEFAGTSAAVVRALTMYRLPVLRAPLRAGRWILPAISPALALGVQSGWADARGAEGLAALNELGMVAVASAPIDGQLRNAVLPQRPISRPTDGVRTSVFAGFRFFGGAIALGVARPVDRQAQWKLLMDFTQIQ